MRSDPSLAPLLDALAAAAARGWRPADVEHALRAGRARAEADLVAVVARGDHPGPVSPRLVAAATAHVRILGPIPFVTEPVSVPGIDDAVLAKVRALLAKAESTNFEAEAEALVAKAHELMVRHAIDEAVLAGDDRRGEVGARRVFVEDPYGAAKAALLARVARACSCRAVHFPGCGSSTVFGHDADLDAVELLYTSLLLQATGAVLAVRPAERRGSSSVAAYRRAWLYAFAQRVGERLSEARDTAAAGAAAEHGRSLVPVLASRAAAAEAAMREAIPDLGRGRRRQISSGEGWAAGRAAADRATLAGQAPLPARPRALSPG